MYNLVDLNGGKIINGKSSEPDIRYLSSQVATNNDAVLVI